MHLFSPTKTSATAQQMMGFRMRFCTDLDCWENQNATVQSEPQVAITSSQAAFEPLLKKKKQEEKHQVLGAAETHHENIPTYKLIKNAGMHIYKDL